jgi:hypothetical protein
MKGGEIHRGLFFFVLTLMIRRGKYIEAFLLLPCCHGRDK